MKVLLAIDGSDHARRAADWLAQQRKMFDPATPVTCVFIETPPPLRAVGVFGADPGMPPLPPVDPTELAAPVLAMLQAAGFAPELMVRDGDPGLEIAQIAGDGGYGLIVMGTHGRGFFKRTVLGSVANKVLASCQVPVLLVR